MKTLRLPLIAGCLLALATSAFAQGAKPNIILILADDLGWADLGCYGADLHETPRIDAFAGLPPSRQATSVYFASERR